MMLCFVFAALIVVLDQLFKRWIVLTLAVGERGPEIIPGILGLRHLENDGAMLNILSGQQWLLAGIALVVSIALVMILLRYNEGFMGTLGLSAVLGGAVGNLIDRVFNGGSVIDMFETLFISFPIFNFADVFITLGFTTFIIHFIALSLRAEREQKADIDDDYVDFSEESDDVYDEFPDIDAAITAKAEQNVGGLSDNDSVSSEIDNAGFVAASDTDFSLDNLSSDLGSALPDDYDIDELLREYGSDDYEDS